jgi:ATP-dependent protease ClpP protease subunit
MPKTNHVFHFYGSINPRSFENLRSQILDGIMNHGAKHVSIYISSEGGDLCPGFTAYNFIRGLPVPVTVVNMGTVESIAVLMYLAADERLCVTNGRFLLHSFHWGFGNSPIKDHSRLCEHALSLDIDAERYAKIFEERTKGAEVPVDIRQCLNSGARILDASSAAVAGIATKVVPAEGTITCDDTHWWPNVCV